MVLRCDAAGSACIAACTGGTSAGAGVASVAAGAGGTTAGAGGGAGAAGAAALLDAAAQRGAAGAACAAGAAGAADVAELAEAQARRAAEAQAEQRRGGSRRRGWRMGRRRSAQPARPAEQLALPVGASFRCGAGGAPVAMCGRVLFDCTFRGINLWGKVQFVDAIGLPQLQSPHRVTLGAGSEGPDHQPPLTRQQLRQVAGGHICDQISQLQGRSSSPSALRTLRSQPETLQPGPRLRLPSD